MPARVAINGMGRIGRALLRLVLPERALCLVAVNDLAPADNLAYLLRYDTAYGRLDEGVDAKDSAITVGGHTFQVLNEKDPARLPWGDLGIDLVFECSGLFCKRDQMRKHLEAGADRVVLSAPGKDDVTTIVYGVNHGDAEGVDLVSCASCTTNCIAPVMEVLSRRIGVRKASMTTVHAYTSSQELVDGPASKWRRGRAAAANIVPTTTGACEATEKAVPAVAGRFDGVALRVPVTIGSIADIVCLTSRATTTEEINNIFREEAATERYRGVLGVTDEPIVSSDVVTDLRACIVDSDLTMVTDGDLVKIMAWYDNEAGYAQQMVRYAVSTVRDLAT